MKISHLPVYFSMALIGLLGCAHAIAEQHRVITSIPIEVTVDAEENAILRVQEIDPTPLQSLRDTLPEFIPVWTDNGMSDRFLGVTCRSEQSTFWASPKRSYPGLVVLMPDNTWKVDMVGFSMTFGLEAGHERLIPGSEDAKLAIALDAEGESLEPFRPQVSLRGPTLITWSYMHAGAPSYTNLIEVTNALEQAVDTWQSLLQLEAQSSSFSIHILFQWEPTLPAGSVLAQAVITGRDDRSWNTWRNNLQTMMLGDDQDSTEEFLYENLPTGSSIMYQWPGGTASTSAITLPPSLLAKWYGVASSDPLVIELNPNLPQGRLYDFDGRTGSPPIAANSYDFEGTVVHELGHHLGFFSETECLESFLCDVLSNWDIFRFPASIGPTISTGEMLSAARGTSIGVPAIAAMAINDSNKTKQLATGVTGPRDGQASHWLDYSPDEPEFIGLMDVTGSPPGNSDLAFGRYLQQSDVLAFDVMGYEIDENEFQLVPISATSQTPASNAILPIGDVTLTWSAGTGAVSYTVGVEDLGTSGTDPGTVVHVARNIPGLSAVVPGAALLPGHQYRWYVVAENWGGYLRGEERVFTIEGGCPADFNGDSVRDVADLFAYINAWLAKTPNADINNDSAVDVADLFAYINAWLAGC